LKAEKDFDYSVITLNPPPNPDGIDLSESTEWNDLEVDYNVLAKEEEELKNRLKEIEAEKVCLQSEFNRLSEGKNAFGNRVKFKVVERKGIIDYKSIPEIKDLDLEPYRKESSSYFKVSLRKD